MTDFLMRNLKLLGRTSMALIMFAAALVLINIFYPSLLRTADQLGDYYAQRGEFTLAAQSYDSPMRQGAAWYHAREFEKAEQSFARDTSPEAKFNRANCLVLQGKYEPAVEQYDLALKERPKWPEAIENRALAQARADNLKAEGGEAGDQRIGADEIVFDKDAKKGGQDTELDDAAITSNSVQDLWLRRVQTKPADFLKYKFAFQAAEQKVNNDK